MTDMPNPSKDDIRRAIEVIQKFWVPLISDGSDDAFSVSLLGDNVVELLKCLIGDSDAIGDKRDLMEDGFRRLEDEEESFVRALNPSVLPHYGPILKSPEEYEKSAIERGRIVVWDEAKASHSMFRKQWASDMALKGEYETTDLEPK